MFGEHYFTARLPESEVLQRGYAPLKRIEAYWQSLHDAENLNHQLPKRQDIDPRGIGQDLRNAFILERISADICRIRVSGSVLNDLAGGSARGLPFARLFETGAHKALARIVTESFDRGHLARLTIGTPRIGLQPGTVGEMRLFPLGTESGEVTRLLGAVAFAGRKAPVARALSLRGAQHQSVGVARSAPVEAERFRPTHVPYLRVLCEEKE